MDEPLVLHLELSSDRFDPQEDRWLDQVAGLVGDLRAEVGTVSLEQRPVEGSKGAALSSIALPMTSAGALTASVEVLQGWLGRDRSRSVKVRWTSGGAEQAFELGGTQEGDSFDAVVRAASEQLPAPP